VVQRMVGSALNSMRTWPCLLAVSAVCSSSAPPPQGTPIDNCHFPVVKWATRRSQNNGLPILILEVTSSLRSQAARSSLFSSIRKSPKNVPRAWPRLLRGLFPPRQRSAPAHAASRRVPCSTMCVRSSIDQCRRLSSAFSRASGSNAQVYSGESPTPHTENRQAEKGREKRSRSTQARRRGSHSCSRRSDFLASRRICALC
jgi:hypothetical protein